MLYRRLGRSGLKTSVITYGTGALYKLDFDQAVRIIGAATEAGINHIDTAESYGGGQTEEALGRVLRQLDLRRDRYILATKAFTYGWSDPDAAPHQLRTLNRKYLFDAVDRSLVKLGTDYVDIYYCHQEDVETPIEEIVQAMSDIVQSGRARYWAVSNWQSALMAQADDYAAAHGLHRPIVNQIEYSLLHRAKHAAVQAAAAQRCIGIAAWGPLAGGLLTGKYRDGVPEGSRAADQAMQQAGISDRLVDAQRNEIVDRLAGSAAAVGCTPAQLALAWCLATPGVSTVLTAASSIDQLTEVVAAHGFIEAAEGARVAIDAIVRSHDMSNIPEHMPKS